VVATHAVYGECNCHYCFSASPNRIIGQNRRDSK
jgi:hypothetical protein